MAGADYFSIEPLRVMLSSHCRDRVRFRGASRSMGTLREAIKEALEAIEFGGHQVFEVWIHEEQSEGAAAENAWDLCVGKSREADVFIALYNGNAGWTGEAETAGGGLGICHEEFQSAYNQSPSKVRLIQFPAIEADPGSPDGRFQAYIRNLKLIGVQVRTGEEAVAAAGRAAVSALLTLARSGIGFDPKSGYYAGQALVWSRLDFAARRQVTAGALVEFLSERSGAERLDEPRDTVIYPVAGERVALVCDCIPAAMSTAAARELVGQPFLRDYRICGHLPGGVAGPVHVIACQKSVSETQAIRQLGFPDAIVVAAPFGVYVADEVQKIQMVLIANCRDQSTTRARIQRFLHWLAEQGEGALLARRAVSRRKISDLIAAESVAAPSET